MKHLLFALACWGTLLGAAVPGLMLYAPAAHAQQQLAKERADEAEQRRKQALSEPEGIAVPKRSKLASLASSEQLEKDAVLQYRKLLQQAQSQRALAPEEFPQRQRLQAIAARLIPYTHRFSDRSDAWRWEVNLIGSPQVNAFVMPGGKIVFFTGILDKLKLTDDEVAMIMGHEMAHALLEHSRQRAGQQKLAQGITIGASVFSQILGYGDLGGVIASQGSKLTLLKFGRGDETEADLVGMDIAARAGYDPRAAVTLWQKMGAASKGEPPQFLSTHPSHATRIDTLREAQPKVMPLYERTRRASADDPRSDTGPTGSPSSK
ncbi:MAG: M48 family metallopeptidase [Burkholderiales bacterium]|jgi:Zn-dependent protease with chaperone function|nr:M48 family metallopeptidase [Burkholderiales bacterium]